MEVADPAYFLFEHICKGDSADGIPNCLSEDNSIAVGTRQKPITQKKLEEWWTYSYTKDEKWIRNRTLIDFNYIPEEIKINIIDDYANQINKKVNLRKYLINFDASELISDIQFFI